MLTLIIFLVIIVLVIRSVVKKYGVGAGKKSSAKPGRPRKKTAEERRMEAASADAYPDPGRAPGSYGKKGFSYSYSANRSPKKAGAGKAGGSAAPERKRAKAPSSAAGNSSAVSSAYKNTVKGQDSIISAAIRNTAQTEMDNDADAAAERYMDRVREIMVKGPDDIPVFERDFIAEGTDMLNSYLDL